jgi:hypothetical protein
VWRQDGVDGLRFVFCESGVVQNRFGVDSVGGCAGQDDHEVDNGRAQSGVGPVDEQDTLGRQQDVVRIEIEVNERRAVRSGQAFLFEPDESGDVVA